MPIETRSKRNSADKAADTPTKTIKKKKKTGVRTSGAYRQKSESSSQLDSSPIAGSKPQKTAVSTSGACEQTRQPSSQLDSSLIPATPAPDKQIAYHSTFARGDSVKIFGQEVEVDTLDGDGEHIRVLHGKTVHFKIHPTYLRPIACAEHTGESHARQFKKGDTAEIHGLPGKVVIEEDNKVTINIDGVHLNVELQHVQLHINRVHTIQVIDDNPQNGLHLLDTSEVNKDYSAMALVRDYVKSVSRAHQQGQEGKADHNGAAAGASATTRPGLAR